MFRLEQLRRPLQVAEGELEEELLSLRSGAVKLGDLLVVGVAAADRLVEDRRVGGEPGDGEIGDVALERPVVEDRPGDVVEPEALSQLVQLFGRLYDPLPSAARAITSRAASATLSGVKPYFV